MPITRFPRIALGLDLYNHKPEYVECKHAKHVRGYTNPQSHVLIKPETERAACPIGSKSPLVVTQDGVTRGHREVREGKWKMVDSLIDEDPRKGLQIWAVVLVVKVRAKKRLGDCSWTLLTQGENSL